jgi:hypothetical protein
VSLNALVRGANEAQVGLDAWVQPLLPHPVDIEATVELDYIEATLETSYIEATLELAAIEATIETDYIEDTLVEEAIDWTRIRAHQRSFGLNAYVVRGFGIDAEVA